jgi:hypothetical protein
MLFSQSLYLQPLASCRVVQTCRIIGFGDAGLKAATPGLAFSSPRLEQSVRTPLASVAGAGAHICGGTCERIR